MSAPLLAVGDLSTEFKTDHGRFRAVDEVSFSLQKGKTLGVVGESGCGKSVTALSIMGLVPNPPGNIVGGSIRFEGEELVGLAPEKYQSLRGNRMGMIFQEPMTSLNPAFTVGDQISEAILRHAEVSQEEAKARTIELLRRVRIPSPEKRFDDYPHKLSGGMRQRAMIAMALSCSPDLLIADEPTTALDVTIQAQILDLLGELRAETGMAIMLITHDLGVIAEMADEVLVMYAGRVIERAPAAALFSTPQHPYTIGLMGSVPRLDLEQERLAAIQGQVPNLTALPQGCRFRARCPFAIAACAETDPPLVEVAPGHQAACLRAPLEA
ncbi:MAG: ABC transporter ATP-binding protein [Rhodospirillaceae bacterium]|nr:ABC transporter ATP-binding protein [Rhodospirillaceae bacterium]